MKAIRFHVVSHLFDNICDQRRCYRRPLCSLPRRHARKRSPADALRFLYGVLLATSQSDTIDISPPEARLGVISSCAGDVKVMAKKSGWLFKEEPTHYS